MSPPRQRRRFWLISSLATLLTAPLLVAAQRSADRLEHPTPASACFELRGTWEVPGERITSSGTNAVWHIGGTVAKPVLKLNGVNCAITWDGTQLVVRLPCAADDPAGATATEVIVAEGRNDTLRGSLQRGDGSVRPWVASRTAAFVTPATMPKSETPVSPP